MTTPPARPPEEPVLSLLGDPLPPLPLTVLLGALTSLQLSGGIVRDATRGLLATGRRVAGGRYRPRV